MSVPAVEFGEKYNFWDYAILGISTFNFDSSQNKEYGMRSREFAVDDKRCHKTVYIDKTRGYGTWYMQWNYVTRLWI